MGTAKGYTGQYGDPSGLDYYNARYYDPVVGLFISVDTLQDNLHGFDPYAYVGGNPETLNDPTGRWGWGLAALFVGVAALGVVAAAVVGIVAAPLLVAAAVGVVTTFAVSTAVGAMNGAFTTTDSNFDDWGFRTLVSEGIGAATGAFAYGLGNVVQNFAEITNGSSWGGVFRTVLSPAQSVSANLAGQGIANSISGTVAATLNLSHIHHPGYQPPSQPPSHQPSPVPHPSPSSWRPTPSAPVSPRSTPSAPVWGWPASSGANSGVSYYTVASGDSLWAIAARFYGSGSFWQSVYQANRGVIGSNPNLIYPGERLAIRR